jgi:hypothetical protein
MGGGHNRNWELRITNKNFIKNNILPYFETHPLFSKKAKSYLRFKFLLGRILRLDHKKDIRSLRKMIRYCKTINPKGKKGLV